MLSVLHLLTHQVPLFLVAYSHLQCPILQAPYPFMGTGAFADQGLGLEKIDSLPRAILALAMMSSMGAASAIDSASARTEAPR